MRDAAGAAAGRIRAGLLYRCGHLHRANEADLRWLLELDPGVIVDLRFANERADEPSPWPPALLTRVLSQSGDPAEEAPHLALLRTGRMSVADVEQFYDRLYRNLPFDPLYRALFAQAAQAIAESEGPVLVHCSAGKDRTGMLVGLLLDWAGLDRSAILADYMGSAGDPGLRAMKDEMTARSLARHGTRLPDAAMEALLGVREAYLMATFAAVEQRCGSVAGYFAQAGLDGSALLRLRRRLGLADA